jgi:hypothetical protein
MRFVGADRDTVREHCGVHTREVPTDDGYISVVQLPDVRAVRARTRVAPLLLRLAESLLGGCRRIDFPRLRHAYSLYTELRSPKLSEGSTRNNDATALATGFRPDAGSRRKPPLGSP